MKFDAYKYNYPSRRNIIYAKKGMVATSHPLAAQAGLEILKKGAMPLMQLLRRLPALLWLNPHPMVSGGMLLL